jgi:CheY-like chemotaxis protein
LTDVPDGPRVIVLADDLIWADRLGRAVEAAGGRAVRIGTDRALAVELASSPDSRPFAVIDLTARAYDGIEAVRQVTASGTRVLAVSQHDDQPTRQAALEAGAERVLAYRKLHAAGPETVGAFLAGRFGSRATS